MEKEKAKRALKELMLAIKGNHLTYHAVFDDPEFQKILIEVLKEKAEWSDEDEREFDVLAEKVKKEIEGRKTIREKFKIIKEILKIGGAAVIGAGVGLAGYATYQRLSKSKKKKH